MTVDAQLIADIDQAERCELVAYRDTENLWTIGWGHLLDQSIDWTGHTIIQGQADAWRAVDIEKAIMYAQRLGEWKALDTNCRRNALYELCFNMGSRWLEFVHTRAALVLHDWQGAHDGLLASKWALQVKAHRAHRLANYLLTGAYPDPTRPHLGPPDPT